MDFRRDINGLRAWAVLAVILFHFNPAWLPGGYAGVDVFFVISGYLMTSIICRGLQQDKFRVFQFYLARGRRIIPALLAPCLLLLVLGWCFLLPPEYLALGKHVAGSLAFVSNMVYWKEAGYFAAGAHEKWLLHTWSLSVEWQFYLLYPLALMAVRRLLGLRALRWAVLAGALLSFGLSVYATPRFPDGAFFLLPTRAWEMMMGGLALLFPLGWLTQRPRLTEACGLLMIAASYILISESNPWPGSLALLPVTGAFLVIQANRQQGVPTNNPLFQWLGNISYSLYLWHWPIVVLLAYWGVLTEPAWQLGGIAASLAAAYASYLWVEQPMRTRVQPRWSASWAGASAALLAMGGAVVLTNGMIGAYRPVSVSDRASFVAAYGEKYKHLTVSHWIDKCNVVDVLSRTGKPDTDPICTTKQGDGGVFLWGDSHAEALSFGLRAQLPKGTPFYQVTSAGCRPSLHDDIKQKGLFAVACKYSNQFAMKKIAELRPTTVVMAQQRDHEKTDWREIGAALKAAGVRQAILVGPVPQWQPSLPIVIVNRHWSDPHPYIQDAALDQSILRTNAKMRALTAGTGVTFVSVIDQLCRAEACLARVPPASDLLLVDYGHLSEEGSSYVVKNLLVPQLMR
ncbi:acyltransferase family protein [Duganella sp.]|uniref:acyltransferase family protein n=1 Tax=Duganella sp. TaxID=1904440 RepID=UPI0031E43B09